MERTSSIALTFLTQGEVAELLRLPERTLEDWRLTGPRRLRLARQGGAPNRREPATLN